MQQTLPPLQQSSDRSWLARHLGHQFSHRRSEFEDENLRAFRHIQLLDSRHPPLQLRVVARHPFRLIRQSKSNDR